MKIQVSDADFVKACVTGKTPDEIVKLTGLKKSTVLSRANKMRKLGVKIPEFERAKKNFNVDELNKLIPG